MSAQEHPQIALRMDKWADDLSKSTLRSSKLCASSTSTLDNPSHAALSPRYGHDVILPYPPTVSIQMFDNSPFLNLTLTGDLQLPGMYRRTGDDKIRLRMTESTLFQYFKAGRSFPKFTSFIGSMLIYGNRRFLLRMPPPREPLIIPAAYGYSTTSICNYVHPNLQLLFHLFHAPSQSFRLSKGSSSYDPRLAFTHWKRFSVPYGRYGIAHLVRGFHFWLALTAITSFALAPQLCFHLQTLFKRILGYIRICQLLLV
ncbi:hypothetical protein BDZ89DRAFT_1243888 [Hymenopellis radicata]|nr:hypothetical protein BDZ89DRAFT_1243888 [Hymenopellis radicata]